MSLKKSVSVVEVTEQSLPARGQKVPRECLHMITANCNRCDTPERREALKELVKIIAEDRGETMMIDESEAGHPDISELVYAVEVGGKMKRLHAHITVRSRGLGFSRFNLERLRETANALGISHINVRYVRSKMQGTLQEMSELLRRYLEKEYIEGKEKKEKEKAAATRKPRKSKKTTEAAASTSGVHSSTATASSSSSSTSASMTQQEIT